MAAAARALASEITCLLSDSWLGHRITDVSVYDTTIAPCMTNVLLNVLAIFNNIQITFSSIVLLPSTHQISFTDFSCVFVLFVFSGMLILTLVLRASLTLSLPFKITVPAFKYTLNNSLSLHNVAL